MNSKLSYGKSWSVSINLVWTFPIFRLNFTKFFDTELNLDKSQFNSTVFLPYCIFNYFSYSSYSICFIFAPLKSKNKKVRMTIDFFERQTFLVFLIFFWSLLQISLWWYLCYLTILGFFCLNLYWKFFLQVMSNFVCLCLNQCFCFILFFSCEFKSSAECCVFRRISKQNLLVVSNSFWISVGFILVESGKFMILSDSNYQGCFLISFIHEG